MPTASTPKARAKPSRSPATSATTSVAVPRRSPACSRIVASKWKSSAPSNTGLDARKALPRRGFFISAGHRSAAPVFSAPQQGYASPMNTLNADPAELQKFSDLAHRWWDPASEFKPLHEINPLRLGWIDGKAALAGKKVLDIGCGGGILAEGMASIGADVTGIDLSEKALSVARLHLFESGHKVDYRLISAEALAEEAPASFDVVTCMEMLEH